ncbi:MAG: TonB-dependent receptor [Acidobacteria bacterium]|nr:TonB-dependent receptor [Acidobacteriota bacterium]
MKLIRPLHRVVIPALALCVALVPALASAQALYGSLTGTVTDNTGAAIPGVTVTVTNEGTGLKLDTVTDGAGSYTVRNVIPGTYTLGAALQGFKTFSQTGIPLTAGNILRVNAQLEIGDLTESITVTTEAALLKTDKADVSVELQPKVITDLPLNQYRNYQALMNLVPGATPGVYQNSTGSTPQRSLRTFVNGTNPNNNSTRIDGAASINIWLPHHSGMVASAETVENVNIVTNSFDADTGMAGGAAIAVVTKSGTNDLKGSAFIFHNNETLNANTFFNNANKLSKPEISSSIFGGTLGGPIVKNRFFYFGSYERYQEERGLQSTYTVPTAAMRNGDFSELLARYPNFRIYDPLTGDASGAGRSVFAGARVPSDRISPIARRIQEVYPMPNSSADLNANGIADDFVTARQSIFNRDNYDAKVTFNRSNSHQIWGKISYLKADVQDFFQLGFDGAGPTPTTVTAPVVGHTWTLTPTLILDGSLGVTLNKQEGIAPDYGTNYGLEWGIPGTNGPSPRESGMPLISTGLSAIGNPSSWNPYFYTTSVYSFTQALTKVAGRHELRFGYDMNYLEMNHWQPEIGSGPRGAFTFGGNTTSAPGYQPVGGWNGYAGFLLGLSSSYGKSVQAEEMTTREWQHGFYIRDRWQVNDKLTLNGGLRFEMYPVMTRANRGIERLDFNTWNVLIGGMGGNPSNVGVSPKPLYVVPRLGGAYRVDDQTVIRAGYGMTINPLPWSRPLRGFYPLTIAFGNSATGYNYITSLEQGIPVLPTPDLTSGAVPLPSGVNMRTPNPDNVDRATLHQWNLTFERRLPLDIVTSVAYVGTRTNGGYADIDRNYADPGTGNAGRQYFARSGAAQILDWGAWTTNKYHSLQVAVNRPFKNGLLLKGAYTWSKAMNMADEDGWTGLTWNHPTQFDRNYARAGYDRTHVFQMGVVYELPFLRESTSPVAYIIKDWQVNGIFSAFSGTPFTMGGNNPTLNAPGAGSITINQSADLTRINDPGRDSKLWDDSVFTHPTGLTFGNSGRNAFRYPGVWNLDLSLFRNIPIGRYRFEIRAQASNVFNHTRWIAMDTGRNSPTYLQFVSSGATDASRVIQLGLRFQF